MGSGLVRRVCGVVLLGALAGCASHAPASSPAAGTTPGQTAAAPSDPALALAAQLPVDAERCTVSVPSRLAPGDRPLAALLSQTDELPWALSLPVVAFARAELQPHSDRRRVLELVRFESSDQAQIRKDLDRVSERPLAWDDTKNPCRDELTCVPVRARFVDAHTVRIATGDWPYGAVEGRSPCAALLAREPHALEVSARAQDRIALGGEGRGTEIVIEARGKQLVRSVRRRFASEEGAEVALRQWLSGRDDVPAIAGLPVLAETTRRGTVVEQVARVDVEDLWLALEDQRRLRDSLAPTSPALAESNAVDVHDADFVRDYVDEKLRELAKLPPAQRIDGLRELDELLVRARRENADDEGLSRRHYSLRMEFRHDPCGATEVAEARLSQGAKDPVFWRLSQRRALASCDEGRLRAELSRAHGLSAPDAARMATELVRNVQRGRDYERSEWAFLTARALAGRAQKKKLAPVSEARIPLAAVPRVLAYLARVSESHEAQDFGVHVLAFGEPNPSFGSEDSLVWTAETAAAGREGTVFAAATWDDGLLVAEGRALLARFPSGALELVIGLDPIMRAPAAGRERAVVRLAGHVEDGQLVIERACKSVAHARWELIERYLVTPLDEMRGSQFPPDELVLEPERSNELEAIVQSVESDGAMRCSVEGPTLRCRGPLDDVRAASRALVRAARIVLAREGRALWAGGD